MPTRSWLGLVDEMVEDRMVENSPALALLSEDKGRGHEKYTVHILLIGLGAAQSVLVVVHCEPDIGGVKHFDLPTMGLGSNATPAVTQEKGGRCIHRWSGRPRKCRISTVPLAAISALARWTATIT